ncbi:MAG: LptA/OstA family protein [Rhodospirillaceae bacterium]|nr:LptA/OstA family protein [Rhodospirillaceae bacterium]
MKSIRLRHVALALLACLLTVPLLAPCAAAQSIGSFDVGATSGDIQIDAEDGIEWRREEGVYIARGNARIARGDLAVYADTLKAFYRGDGSSAAEIYRVEATGNVRLTSPGETVYGEYAVYDVERKVLVMTGGDLMVETANEIITARDSLEYWQDQMVVVARGDAEVVQEAENRRVRADTLTGFFREDDAGETGLFQVEAEGGVRIQRGNEIARAGKAVYNLDTEIATLTGGVKITQGESQLNGDFAEFNLRSGVSRLLGSGEDDGRVQTLIVPGN